MLHSSSLLGQCRWKIQLRKCLSRSHRDSKTCSCLALSQAAEARSKLVQELQLLRRTAHHFPACQSGKLLPSLLNSSSPTKTNNKHSKSTISGGMSEHLIEHAQVLLSTKHRSFSCESADPIPAFFRTLTCRSRLKQ